MISWRKKESPHVLAYRLQKIPWLVEFLNVLAHRRITIKRSKIKKAYMPGRCFLRFPTVSELGKNLFWSFAPRHLLLSANSFQIISPIEFTFTYVHTWNYIFTSILSFLKMQNGKLFRVKLGKQQRSHDGFGVRLGQGHPILKVSLTMEYQESTEKEASALDPHGKHPGWFELQISATLSNLIINKSNYGLRWRLHVEIFFRINIYPYKNLYG